MRIDAIHTHRLAAPIEAPFAFSQRWVHERVSLVVEVVTDAGLVGWGECYGPPRLLQPIVERFYAPLLLRQDALAGAAHWERLYNEIRDHGQRGLAVQALAGLDIALWDLRGKAAAMPIHRLLGGPLRTSARAYATGLYRKTDDRERNRALLVEEAQGYVRQGFLGMKLKVGFDVADDAANARAIRREIGEEPALMVDANHGFDRIDALDLAKRIEPFGIGWFEEPVAPEDVEGYRWLRQRTLIPIAGGECSFTRFDFKGLIETGAVDVVQPDTCAAGGLTECLRIAALAGAAGLRYHPHVWGTGIAVATALQLIAVLPGAAKGLLANEPWLEFDRTPHPFRDAILTTPFAMESGRVAVPTGPGLGIEVDREALARFRIDDRA